MIYGGLAISSYVLSRGEQNLETLNSERPEVSPPLAAFAPTASNTVIEAGGTQAVVTDDGLIGSSIDPSVYGLLYTFSSLIEAPVIEDWWQHLRF